MQQLPCSILGGDPFSDVFRGLYNARSFWNLTDPQYCLSVMKAAYEGGCRAFDYSFSAGQQLFMQLRQLVDEPIFGLSNPTWLQGFTLGGRPLQYARNRILRTITTGGGILQERDARLIAEKLRETTPMVFGYDLDAPCLTPVEIESIRFDRDLFDERFDEISEAEYVLIGGTDADWLFALGRSDLIVELARLVRSKGKIPILIGHYTSFILPLAESLEELDVAGYAVPLNSQWSWFSKESSEKAVWASKKPVIVFMPFGSGSLTHDLDGAIRYFTKFPTVISLLFGTTKAPHAFENAKRIRSVMAKHGDKI